MLADISVMKMRLRALYHIISVTPRDMTRDIPARLKMSWHFFKWIPNFQKFSKLKRSKFQADFEGTFLSQFRKYLPTSIQADVKFRTRLTFNTKKYFQKLCKNHRSLVKSNGLSKNGYSNFHNNGFISVFMNIFVGIVENISGIYCLIDRPCLLCPNRCN